VLRIRASQLGDHFFGETVIEIFLARIAAVVQEGQHRQHDFLARGLGAKCKALMRDVADQNQQAHNHNCRDVVLSLTPPGR
jgi:primosomal protein N''